MTSSSPGESGRPEGKENRPHTDGGDAIFHFADKTAGILSAFGFGYLVLHALPAALWIAIVCLIIGLGAKIVFRAL